MPAPSTSRKMKSNSQRRNNQRRKHPSCGCPLQPGYKIVRFVDAGEAQVDGGWREKYSYREQRGFSVSRDRPRREQPLNLHVVRGHEMYRTDRHLHTSVTALLTVALVSAGLFRPLPRAGVFAPKARNGALTSRSVRRRREPIFVVAVAEEVSPASGLAADGIKEPNCDVDVAGFVDACGGRPASEPRTIAGRRLQSPATLSSSPMRVLLRC